jgi:hypothetical protein
MLDPSVVIGKNSKVTGATLAPSAPDVIIDSGAGATVKVVAGRVMAASLDNSYVLTSAWRQLDAGATDAVPAGSRVAYSDGGLAGGAVLSLAWS